MTCQGTGVDPSTTCQIRCHPIPHNPKARRRTSISHDVPGDRGTPRHTCTAQHAKSDATPHPTTPNPGGGQLLSHDVPGDRGTPRHNIGIPQPAVEELDAPAHGHRHRTLAECQQGCTESQDTGRYLTGSAVDANAGAPIKHTRDGICGQAETTPPGHHNTHRAGWAMPSSRAPMRSISAFEHQLGSMSASETPLLCSGLTNRWACCSCMPQEPGKQQLRAHSHWLPAALVFRHGCCTDRQVSSRGRPPMSAPCQYWKRHIRKTGHVSKHSPFLRTTVHTGHPCTRLSLSPHALAYTPLPPHHSRNKPTW
jgi:hypothetical protein